MQPTRLLLVATSILAPIALAAGPLPYTRRSEVEHLEGTLFSRGGRHCSNPQKAKDLSPAEQSSLKAQGCNPPQSVGKGSSHNCYQKRAGNAYLCYQDGVWTCTKGKNKVKVLGYENGECFK